MKIMKFRGTIKPFRAGIIDAAASHLFSCKQNHAVDS